MLARAIAMARECAVAGRPAVLERITQWERSLNVFRAAIATATWDEPQVLLKQMDGCRLPIAHIVEPTLGGGNSEGSYATIVEVFTNTPIRKVFGRLPLPAGRRGRRPLHFGFFTGPCAGPQRGKSFVLCCRGFVDRGLVRQVFTKVLWGKGLRQIVDFLPEALDDIEKTHP